MTQGYQLEQSLPLNRLFKSVSDNILLEHGGLPHVLPLAVHLKYLLAIKQVGGTKDHTETCLLLGFLCETPWPIIF